MLTIDIDAVALKAIDRKLEEMQEKIEQLKHTGIADELADWETQDMHRRRPFDSASTRTTRGSTIPSSSAAIWRGAHQREVVGAADLRLPGQPAVPGRHVQRQAKDGLERRHVQRIVPPFSHCDRRENHDADRNNEKEQIASFANGKFHRTYLSGPTAHLLARKAGDASRRNDALRQGASGMGWSYLLYAGYAYDPYA